MEKALNPDQTTNIKDNSKEDNITFKKNILTPNPVPFNKERNL